MYLQTKNVKKKHVNYLVLNDTGIEVSQGTVFGLKIKEEKEDENGFVRRMYFADK
jgi:hypothetical protein